MAVLDTSFLVDLDRRSVRAEAVLSRLARSGEPLLVPAQVAAEYITGLEDEVAALYRIEGSFALVPFGRAQLLECARLARRALEKGKLPGWADTQVAALAALEHTYVVSANKGHFRALGVACWDHRKEPDPPT